MDLRLLRQHFDGFVVDHIAAVVDQAVLAVASVGVERDIGHHAEFGEILLQCGDHARHEAVRVVGLACIQALQWRIDHRKDRHHRNTQLDALLSILEQQVQGFALHPRHGLDILCTVTAFQHEDRVDQIRRCEHMLTHQVPRKGIAAHAAHPGMGILP